MKDHYVFDIETNGLNATKIHCLSYHDLDSGIILSLSNYSDIKKFVSRPEITLIGHNICRYDIPTLERILNITVKAKLIDTLPLSWTLYPKQKSHGLGEWGEFFGVPKPKVDDWSTLSLETYIHRCEEDVKINTKLWYKQYNYLLNLYDNDLKEISRYCQYLSFKMNCVREQEEVGIKLDIGHCDKTLATLVEDKKYKLEELKKVMPRVEVKKKKIYENAVEDNDGNIFQKGDLFYNALAQTAPKKIEKSKVKGSKESNPNSSSQIKDWLYSLGWKPEHIKHVRDKKTSQTKEIVQIGAKTGQGEICNSIKKLFKKEPKLEVLDGLSLLSHRIGIFEGFLKNKIKDRLYPACMGLTNTLRLQHAVVVNLPGVKKKYGKDVRGCLIADNGAELCGSDLSNIEDRTKRHYIYQYDPKYVEEMNVEGYDAHLEIGLLAGLLTQDDIDFFKNFDKKVDDVDRYNKIASIRTKSKIVNFSATYKVGKATLARNSGLKLSEAAKLLKIYWTRNKDILNVENSLKIKEIGDQKWLLNPVSNFWYSLRNDKDKFSTLNQGTAVYAFDQWVYFVRKEGIKIALQMHDEILFNTLDKEKTTKSLNIAMDKVNDKLKLNIKVGCSIEYGNSYSTVH
jgi:hypothetical protein